MQGSRRNSILLKIKDFCNEGVVEAAQNVKIFDSVTGFAEMLIKNLTGNPARRPAIVPD